MNLAFWIGFIGIGRQERDERLQERGVDTAWNSERYLPEIRMDPLAVDGVELTVVVELLDEYSKYRFPPGLSAGC